MQSGHLTEFLSHHVGMFSILIERLEFESKLHLRFQAPAFLLAQPWVVQAFEERTILWNISAIKLLNMNFHHYCLQIWKMLQLHYYSYKL